MKKVVLFDLDGTILDTLDDLADSVNAALAHYGFPPRTKEEICSFVGSGVLKLIERAVPDGTPAEAVDAAYHFMLTYYGSHSDIKTRPFDGILEMLKRLKAEGHLLAVVSNKRDPFVGPLCEHYFSGIFDAAVGERSGVKRKPAPDAVYEILRLLGAEKADCVFIGDSDVDILTAQNAGIPAIGVTWGFRSEACLRDAGCLHFARTADELYTLIKAL